MLPRLDLPQRLKLVASHRAKKVIGHAKRLAGDRTENGLYPKEQYCGDISTFVYSLNVNSKAWRARRCVKFLAFLGYWVLFR